MRGANAKEYAFAIDDRGARWRLLGLAETPGRVLAVTTPMRFTDEPIELAADYLRGLNAAACEILDAAVSVVDLTDTKWPRRLDKQ